MNRKRLFAVAAGVAFAAGLAALALTRGPLAPVKVSVAEAKPESLQVEVFGIGTVEARYSYAVGPTQTGRIAAVLVDHGERVAAGQVLARMDPIDLAERLAATAAALARARDSLRAAQAQTREAQTRLDIAASSAVRYRALAAKGFVSAEAAAQRSSEAQAMRAALDGARAQADGAQRDVERLARERDAVARQIDNLQLRSPVEGIVIERLAEPGTTVVAGQAVLKLIDPSSAWVRTWIDQARAGALRPGQHARIVLRSRRGEPLPGKVARVELQSDAVTEERVVNVAFDELPRGVSIGELAEVTVEGERIEDALVIPQAAVRRVGGETGVWRVQDGRARFQVVKTGMNSLEGAIELLAGLGRGEEVIVHASAQLSEGDRVRVVASP